jgi:TolB-like protein/predicted negative regulator of RcsB-dependent stress response
VRKSILFGLFAMLVLVHPVPAEMDLAAPVSPDNVIKTLAVLDFRNLGPSVELDPLRKAMARMLTTDLASYENLELVSRARIDRFLEETRLGESGLVAANTAQQAGKVLAADYLIQGSFSGTSDGIKVHLEVLDVANGQSVGVADAFAKAEEALTVEQKLLADVVQMLKLKATHKAHPAPQSSNQETTLAVLYLQNLTPDAKLDPLQTGLTDMLITQLQYRPGLAVVEREQLNKVLEELQLQQSALSENARSAQVGKLLGAQVLLLGSFFVMKDTIRFDAHLVAPDTGELLQAVSAQGEANDLEPVIQDLADKTAAALAARPRTLPIIKRNGKASLEAALHYSRGKIYLDQSQGAQAAEEFERALYLDPDNPWTLNDLAFAYQYQGRSDKALEMRERLVSLGEPWLSAMSNLLANDYDLLGQTEKALLFAKNGLEAVQQHREQHPWYVEAALLETLAQINLHAGDREREKHLIQVSRENPPEAGSNELLPTPEELRKYEEGKKWYLQAIALASKHPENPGLRIGFRNGLIASAQGRDRETVVQQLEAVLAETAQYDPEGQNLYADDPARSLGRLYQETSDYDQAKRVFGKVIRKYPDALVTGSAQYSLAEVALACGREEEAADLFVGMADQWWPRHPLAKEALFRAAMLYNDRLGEPQQAAELQRRIGRQFGRYTRCDVPVNSRLSRTCKVDANVGPPFQTGKPRPVLFFPGCEPRLRAALIADGKQAHDCDQANLRPALADYSALVVGFDGFDATEKDVEAVRAFVASGGGLFLEVDHRAGCRPYAHLLRTMGINPAGDTTAFDFYGSDPKPTVLNPQQTALPAISPPYILGARSLNVAAGSTIVSYEDKPLVTAFHYGLGRVIISGIGYSDFIINFWRDNWKTANAAFFCAAVDWLQGKDEKNPAREGFEAAQRKLAEGDQNGAIAELRKIVAANPDTHWGDEAQLAVADIFLSRGNLATAADEYQKLSATKANSQLKALARLNLARIQAASGTKMAGKALEDCWAIWHDDPTSVWAAIALLEGARWAYQAGEYTSSQKAAEAVMNGSQDDLIKAQAMLYAALCREKVGDSEGAVRIYRAIEEQNYPFVLQDIIDKQPVGSLSCFVAQRLSGLSP